MGKIHYQALSEIKMRKGEGNLPYVFPNDLISDILKWLLLFRHTIQLNKLLLKDDVL